MSYTLCPDCNGDGTVAPDRGASQIGRVRPWCRPCLGTGLLLGTGGLPTRQAPRWMDCDGETCPCCAGRPPSAGRSREPGRRRGSRETEQETEARDGDRSVARRGAGSDAGAPSGVRGRRDGGVDGGGDARFEGGQAVAEAVAESRGRSR